MNNWTIVWETRYETSKSLGFLVRFWSFKNLELLTQIVILYWNIANDY